MSSLNKAFIKAFDKSKAKAAQPAQSGGPHFRATPAPTAAARDDKSAQRANTVDALIARGAEAKRRLEPAPAERTPATAPPVAHPQINAAAVAPAPTASPPTSSSSGKVAPASPSRQAPAPITIVDTAHAGVRAPYANFADPPRPAAMQPPQVVTPTTLRSTSPVVPLETTSSEAAATGNAPINPRPVILPMTGPSPVWRPVFEVTNFTWPELTDVLLAAAAAQFRTAAGDLAEACRRHRKLVAITAGHRGEGCTVVTLALAKALVEQNQRVILVDAHFEAPGLAESLGVATQVGWEETLTGEKALTEAMVESLEDRLMVLPLRQPANSEWRLSVARLKAAFDELRRHADVVLVDAGPFGADGERRNLVSWAGPCRVDRALVVRDLRTTGDDETAEIERRLHGCGIAQWNFVENFAAA